MSLYNITSVTDWLTDWLTDWTTDSMTAWVDWLDWHLQTIKSQTHVEPQSTTVLHSLPPLPSSQANKTIITTRLLPASSAKRCPVHESIELSSAKLSCEHSFIQYNQKQDLHEPMWK